MSSAGPVFQAISAVGTVLGGIAAVKQATTKPEKATPIPKDAIPEIKEMPTPDDNASRAAAQRRVAGITNRSGRQSTVLSQAGDNDTLG